MRTYGKLSRQNGAWILDADPHVHMRAKRIFRQLSRAKRGNLSVAHSLDTCRDLLWLQERYPLEMEPDDRRDLEQAAAEHRDRIARLDELIDPNYTPPTFEMELPARDYQAREAAIYLTQGSLLIADDVGLGKTASAICSFTEPRTLPAVVVTLTHLPFQWQEQIAKFAPGLNAHVVKKGTPYELPKFFGHGPDVVILNYHKMAGWAKVLAEYGRSVVFDEIQELRRSGTNRYAAAETIARGMDFCLGLSATPVYNYGGEFYNIANILRPGCLGSKSEFEAEWCSWGGRNAKLEEPKAFGSWCREQYLLIRHTRQEVKRELPDVVRIVQTVKSDAEALKRVEDGAAELARLILAETPLERGQSWRASQDLNVMLRQATGVAKAVYVAEFVRLLVDSGERVVLCGWHREVYDIWLDRLKDLKPVMYTGTETPAKKEDARKAFCKGKANVLILSLRSGAGLDGLQEASSVIVFGELDWSPGVHEQCIGRLNRDGQESAVAAYFLVAEDGADPVIADILGLKREQIEGIRDPDREVLENIAHGDDGIKELAKRYLKKQPPRKPEAATA